MKRLIIAVAVGSSLLLLFIQSNLVGSLFTRSVATLSIQDAQIPLALYIDNQLAGTLPMSELSISPGVHTFTLRNIKGEDAFNVFWQGELEVNSSDSVVIAVVSTQENSIDGIVVTRFFSKNGQNSFSRIFMEEQAVLYVNEKKFEKTPVVVEDNELSEITIRTEHPVYKDIQFSFTKKQDTSFSSHIYLHYDYVQNITGEDVGLPAEPVGEIAPLRRWEWEFTQRPIPIELFGEDPWRGMRVYSIVIPDFVSTQKTLRDIENQFINLMYAPRLPFCFVIDPEGGVWEGFGVWNYDYTFLKDSPLTNEAGICPVLVVKTSAGQSLNNASLARIQQFILQPPQHVATVQKEFDAVQVKNQERVLVDVSIENTGWSTWHPQDGEELGIMLAQTAHSDMYDQDNWLDNKTPNRVTDPIVIPGGETTLVIPLKAPMYTIQYEEEFILTFDKQVIAGTSFKIPIKVEGIGVAVEVINPPQGFLNVYESDSAETRLLTSLFEGEKHAFLERKGDWVKIRLRDGRDGWTLAQFLRGI